MASKEDNPRHAAIAARIADQITAGRWPVGSLLPSETELCEQFGLSRYALREVATLLERMGMVSRQQGIGTKVIAERPMPRYTQTMQGLEDLAQYAKGTRFVILDKGITKAEEHLAPLLRSAPATKWLRIRGVRSAGLDGPPISYADIYVREPYSKLGPLKNSLDTPIYKLIESKFGIKVSCVEQEICAVAIDGDAAAALQVPPGSPGMRIVRSYFL
ncbi:MAG: GntR family transcriptional regulator, partial [Noviherbaspirillum sp.]